MIQASRSILQKLRKTRAFQGALLLRGVPNPQVGVKNRATVSPLLARVGLITAGGEGSGCHGPNCGRPKTAAGYLSKAGWQKIQTLSGQPHWKGTIGPAIHNIAIYKHPKFPNQEFRVHSAAGFAHVIGGNIAHKGPSGKFGVEMGKYLKQVNQSVAQSTPVTVDPSIEKKSGPPEGMANAYKGVNTGNTYTWSDEHQAYISPKAYSSGYLVKDQYDIQSKLGNWYTPIAELPDKGQSPPNEDSKFTYSGSAKSLGGAFDKHFYTDSDGNKFMFKPAEKLNGSPDLKKAYVDEAVSTISSLVKPDGTVPVSAVKLTVPGKGEVAGSIQKMISPLGKHIDFDGRDPSTLKPWEVKGLQREQVVDWLVSNHDSHENQFLRDTQNHQVYGVDKTQAFKNLGKDVLNTYYGPNAGEKEPYYNKMWEAVQQGKLSFDPHAIDDVVQKIKGISDNDYKSLLSSYAVARYDNSKDANAFLDAAVARKNSLPGDFASFYAQVSGKPVSFDSYDDQKPAIKMTTAPFNKPGLSLDEVDKMPGAVIENETGKWFTKSSYGNYSKPGSAYAPSVNDVAKGLATGKYTAVDDKVSPQLMAPKPNVQDPPAQFSKKFSVDVAQMKQDAQDIYSKYQIGKTATVATSMSRDLMQQWMLKLGVPQGSSAHYSIAPETGKNYTPEQLQKAAQGLGVYPELAAKHGLTPWDMLDMQQSIKEWTGSSSYDAGAKMRPAAQEVVMGKCCSDRFTASLAVEHAVTVAKLNQMEPGGTQQLVRGVGKTLLGGLEYCKSHNLDVTLKTLGAECWADKDAKNYGSFGDINLNVKVSHDNVISSYATNHEAFAGHPGEREVIVAFPKQTHTYKPGEITKEGTAPVFGASQSLSNYMSQHAV
jgi:hypothetical protein